MAGRHRPFFTENFAGNLESIRLFLGQEGRSAFRRLVDRLFDDVVPTLSRFPKSGRSFLAHPVRSIEAEGLMQRLEDLLRKNDDLPGNQAPPSAIVRFQTLLVVTREFTRRLRPRQTGRRDSYRVGDWV